jgi:hypothetical protein
VRQLEHNAAENKDTKNINLLTRGLNLLNRLNDFESAQKIAQKFHIVLSELPQK